MGVLGTTAATKENGWDWTKHKTLPRAFWNKPQIELKKGDVIVTKAGPRNRVGVTAWVHYVPPRIIPSGKMIALRPRSDKVVPLMLAAAIAARDAQTYLDQRTTGMAESQVNFENIALLEAPIRIPPIEEQNAIAATEHTPYLTVLRPVNQHPKQQIHAECYLVKTIYPPDRAAHAEQPAPVCKTCNCVMPFKGCSCVRMPKQHLPSDGMVETTSKKPNCAICCQC